LGKKEYGIANRLFRISSFMRLVSNVCILFAVIVFWESIAPVLKISAYKSYFLLFCFVIILHMQRELLEIYLDAYFFQKFTTGFALIFTLIKCMGYSAVILLEKGLWEVLIIDLASYSVVFILLELIYIKKRNDGAKQGPKLPSSEKRRLFRYAFFYNFNDTGVGLLQADFDNFILAGMLDPIAVGAYSFCQRISKTIQRLSPITYFQNVIRPAFFFMASSENSSLDVGKFFKTTLKINLLFNIPFFLFVAFFGKEIIHVVFGGKFIEYAGILTAVYFFGMINSCLSPIGLVAQLRERADIILYSKIFAVYNLIADLVLIRYFGILGAVLATGTAILFKNIFIWFFVRSDVDLIFPKNFLIKFTLFWSIAFAAAWAASSAFTNPLLSFLSGAVIFFMLSIGQFKLDLFNNHEKSLLSEGIKSKKILSILNCRVPEG
jgi:O-antigen/teichoic acid export membrane protein